MKYRAFRPFASTLVIVVFVVVAMAVTMARKANAQGTSNNPILAAVEQVQSSLAALVSPTASKVRFTPMVSAGSGDLSQCLVVNVTSVTRNVQVQLINGVG